MKKILIFAAILVLLFSIIGCTSKKEIQPVKNTDNGNVMTQTPPVEEPVKADTSQQDKTLDADSDVFSEIDDSVEKIE